MAAFRFLNKFSAILFSLSFSSLALSEPFTVTYSDTIRFATGPFINGEAFTISVVLDNGGTTAASQTWTSADIVSITFNLNNAPGTISTVLSPVVLTSSSGSFATDAGGVLTAVPSNWSDGSALSTPLSSNDPGGTADIEFYINGGNRVYYNESSGFAAGMTNVANNIVASFWTNPAAAAAPAAPATPVPTLSQWAMVLLSLMLLAIGLVNARRLS